MGVTQRKLPGDLEENCTKLPVNHNRLKFELDGLVLVTLS